MEEKNPERLVVVTSTPDGIAPLTAGERSMMEHEPQQVEQTGLVSHSFPRLRPDDPARISFEQAKQAFADSDAQETIRFATECWGRRPTYLPAHVYEELGLNIARGRDLERCAAKCQETIRLGDRLMKGQEAPPPTEQAIQPEHINEVLDMVRYNLSDRLMRLGRFQESLTQLRLSESLPKGTEAQMKRRIKEASLLFRLKDFEGSRLKLRQARDMDRELFLLVRKRMAFDGHVGVEQPL